MKVFFAVVCAVAVAVTALPTQPPTTDDSAGGGMKDLIASINKIQERVKGMRYLASGNSSGIDHEVMDGINDLSKNVTYENLIEKVQMASQKVQELQKRLSGVLKDLNKDYPRPGDKTEKPATAA